MRARFGKCLNFNRKNCFRHLFRHFNPKKEKQETQKVQKLSQKTPNKTEQHIDQIAQLFPNVMSEGKVGFDLFAY